MLDGLARVVIALHDLGKLDEKWQRWAHRWQEEVGAVRGEDLSLADDYMAAHTDYDTQDEIETALKRKVRPKRPNHAVESARAAIDYVWERTADEALARAVLTAIARHHSAGARGTHGEFRAHPMAPAVLAGILDGFETTQVEWRFSEGSLRPYMIRPDRERELLPYLLLVRALRLADQRSQQVQ
jgi:hypothetical protein